MKKYQLVLVLILGVVGTLGYVVSQNKNNTESASPQIQETVQNDVSQAPVSPTIDTEIEQPSPTKGAYVDYKEDVFTSTKGQRVLFFHAKWCPTCNTIEKDIKNSVIPKDITIFKADYDKENNLKSTYQVGIQTTFVLVDENGAKKRTYVAFSEPTLEAVLKGLGL